jgi:hypothetical protein
MPASERCKSATALRRAAIRTGLSLASLLAICVALTIRWRAGLHPINVDNALYLHAGAVHAQWRPGAADSSMPWAFMFGEHTLTVPAWLRLALWPMYSSGPVTALSVPLWMPLALAATQAVLAFGRGSCRGQRACVECGYDLSGLPPGTACPECGEATGRTHARPEGSA